MAAWPTKRMDQLCEITSSKRIFAADYVSEGVPFYRGREVTEKYKGNLDVSTELFITEEKFAEIERKFGAPKLGDLLLTSVGTLGSVYVVKPGDRFYFKDGNLTWFRNFKGLDSQFLFYWIGSPQGKAELQKCTIGSSQSAFTIVLLKGIEIALPPMPIQQRIAGILSAYDELIENSQRRIKILEAMARGLYREWFVHFRFPGHKNHPRVASALGEIPQGWEVKALGEMTALVTKGTTPTTLGKQFQLEGINFVKAESIEPTGMLIETKFAKIDIETHDLLQRSQLQANDILFSIAGVIGRVCSIPSRILPANTNQALAIVRCESSLHVSWIYLTMRDEVFRNHCLGHVVQTAQANVSLSVLKSVPVIKPPDSDLKRFNSIVEPLLRKVQVLFEQIQNLRRTRDLLLPRLLSGQINVEAP